MEGIELVMNYILPLALTERKHRLGSEWRSTFMHELKLSVAKCNTRTVYVELTQRRKRVGGFDITGFPTVCSKIADALESFDECREYVASRDCELTEVRESDEPYIRSEYEIRVLDNASLMPVDDSSVNLLTAYYIPLFIAEFGPLAQSEPVLPAGRIAIEIAASRDACECSPGEDCSCRIWGRSIMTMPEADPIDRPFGISGCLIREIRNDLLSNLDERCDELPVRGYRLGTDGSTCYIRRADFNRVRRDDPVVGESDSNRVEDEVFRPST